MCFFSYCVSILLCPFLMVPLWAYIARTRQAVFAQLLCDGHWIESNYQPLQMPTNEHNYHGNLCIPMDCLRINCSGRKARVKRLGNQFLGKSTSKYGLTQKLQECGPCFQLCSFTLEGNGVSISGVTSGGHPTFPVAELRLEARPGILLWAR